MVEGVRLFPPLSPPPLLRLELLVDVDIPDDDDDDANA